jgi:hypothetical protein
MQNNQQEAKEIRYSKIKDSLIIAYDRVMAKPPPVEIIDRILDDILFVYKSTRTSDILEHISNGSRGKYGRSMRFTFQEVSYWILSNSRINKL